MSLSFLWAYPIATLSSLAVYALLIALVIPKYRRVIEPLLVHPVAPHQQYLQAFDCFRGFAAALVALGHCWWATHPIFHSTQLAVPFLAYGAKAVPIFAVLSGFLIYRSVLSVRTLETLREYIIRRFFRIYPVYLLSVVLCLVTLQYVPKQYFTKYGYFVSDLLMLNSLYWPGGFANPVTWSLYVEIAFYAVLPLVVLAIGQKRMVAFAILGIVALIIADYPSRVFGLWKFFLMGILASEFSARMKPYAIPAFLAGLALLVIDFTSPKYDWVANLGIVTQHQDGETIGLGLASGLMLASIPHWGTLSRALNVLPLRLLGVISYSLYVVHFFYILANFPKIGLFTDAGTTPMYEYMKAQPQMAWWYMPFVFFPGVLLWSLVSFLLIERPGIQYGARLIARLRAQARPSIPVAKAAE